MVLVSTLFQALLTVLSWPVVGFVILGTLFGILFGAIPGIGGVIALTLLIPLTFDMNTVSALALFAATMGGVAFGGSVSAILVNTPGTPPNAATCFDGYPLARRGRGSEAISISATASALGALVGIAVFYLTIPVARRIILSFAPPEFFWLSLLGLATIAIVTRGNALKGLISAGVGLLVSFVGFDSITGTVRYGFGIDYLWDGVQLVPVFIGLFAIAEVIRLSTGEGTIASRGTVSTAGSRVRGIRQVLGRPRILLQSSLVGVLVGMVPGAGGTVSNFLSYVLAARTSNDSPPFGEGNPSGIIASEASNDAKDGGSLLPTVAFGLPGSAMAAVLLAGFELHGLNPGPELLSSNIFYVFVLLTSLVIANVLTSVLGLSLSPLLSKVTTVPSKLIAPAILVVSLEGAYVLRYSLGDVFVTILFGFLGYAIVALDYSRIAIALAIILGPLAEKYLYISLQISDSGLGILFERPLSLAIVAIAILLVVVPTAVSARSGLGRDDVSDWLQSKTGVDEPQATGDADGPEAEEETSKAGERGYLDRIVAGEGLSFDSLFAALVFGFVALLLAVTPAYPADASRLPYLVGVPTAVMSFALLVRTLRAEGSTVTRSVLATRRKHLLAAVWILVLFVLIAVAGFRLGTLLFLVAAYRLQANQDWSRTALLTGGVWTTTFLIFEVILRV